MTDLRSFLGLANYYRRFIKKYSKIVNPLTDLLRKDQKWEWTISCDDAFRLLKQAMSSQSVLKLPRFDKPFVVEVDASDRALGGVLVQDKHPVAFESYKLKDAELRYSTHEKEMTAVVHCLDARRHYLLGTNLVLLLIMWLTRISKCSGSYPQSRLIGKSFWENSTLNGYISSASTMMWLKL
ncbi:UNVERIFIED_CONTAM: Retrovirus-related Pol polyprotein from transposon.6 [Sesamum radiatum]|uniref:Retrovirus-related Pol polyprotein from transposon.6 n=1 Tax=Sesamum radiatum TaxID=300843 RepID=A0AAW2K7C2_SESRA